MYVQLFSLRRFLIASAKNSPWLISLCYPIAPFIQIFLMPKKAIFSTTTIATTWYNVTGTSSCAFSRENFVQTDLDQHCSSDGTCTYSSPFLIIRTTYCYCSFSKLWKLSAHWSNTVKLVSWTVKWSRFGRRHYIWREKKLRIRLKTVSEQHQRLNSTQELIVSRRFMRLLIIYFFYSESQRLPWH